MRDRLAHLLAAVLCWTLTPLLILALWTLNPWILAPWLALLVAALFLHRPQPPRYPNVVDLTPYRQKRHG